jgi:hypothetical protein
VDIGGATSASLTVNPVLAGSAGARAEHFFWLIAAGMVVQALVSGTAIRLGAWTRGR